MQRTKDMLMGVTEADTDSPCVKCQVYASMVKNNAWIRPQELVGPSGGNGRNASSLLSRSIRLVGRLYRRARRFQRQGRK